MHIGLLKMNYLNHELMIYNINEVTNKILKALKDMEK